MKIEKYHYNIVSLNDSIIIEDDRVSVLNKGQIVNLDFAIGGIFYLQKVSVYINIIDFANNKKEVSGNFNGVDINNNILNGKVLIVSLN